jgi:antitoxin Phd
VRHERAHAGPQAAERTRAIASARVWLVQDAKARLSELLDACLTDESRFVTRRGAEMAVMVPIVMVPIVMVPIVMVPIKEWQRVSQAAPPCLKALLLAPYSRFDMPLPARKGRHGRPAPNLD